MKIIKQRLIDLIRRNKSFEIVAYLIQNFLDVNHQGSGEFAKYPEEMHNHFRSVSENYVKQLGPEVFTQKVILELGTGFSRSGMLHLIKKYDIKKVYCYDKYNCLHKDELDIIKKEGLECYMDKLTYIVGKDKDILNYVEIGSVDTIISNAVLEFVFDLDSLVKVLGAVAKSDSVSFHRVDLKCHNKFKSYGELYFHTFSNYFWNLMGKRVGQLSRRLFHDYIKIFEDNCFTCNKVNVKKFDKKVLLNSKNYLNVDNIENYSVSDLDIFLTKQ